MALDIGRIAFMAYQESLSQDSPKWEELDKPNQDAWRTAAIAVSVYLDEEEQARKDAGFYSREDLEFFNNGN